MSSKKEFVLLAESSEISFSELCRRFKISRPTGYELIKRYKAQGDKGLEEQSRRPHHSPNKTSPKMEELVIETRQKKPTWGGRLIYSSRE